MADQASTVPASFPRPVSKPKQPLPAGAWDTHAHVFSPFDRYPLIETRTYEPPAAPRDAYVAMLDTVGFSHGVLVHGAANGWDNAGTADAVSANWPRLRGIGVVPVDTSDAELEALDARGIRGVRIAQHRRPPGNPGTLAMADMQAFASRFRVLGWHFQIWATQDLIMQYFPALLAMGVPVVFDHMAFCEVERGVQDPAFQRFMSAMRDSDFHIKLTPGRRAADYPEYAGVRPFHDAYVEAFPDRLVFGSDWPYIGDDAIQPDVGRMVDLFDAWTPDPAIREKVFVTNPQAFYGAR